MHRRRFLVSAAAGAALLPGLGCRPAPRPPRGMFTSLAAGAIGLTGSLDQLIALACRHGFGGLELSSSQLQPLTPAVRGGLARRLAGEGLAVGSGSFPFSLDDE